MEVLCVTGPLLDKRRLAAVGTLDGSMQCTLGQDLLGCVLPTRVQLFKVPQVNTYLRRLHLLLRTPVLEAGLGRVEGVLVRLLDEHPQQLLPETLRQHVRHLDNSFLNLFNSGTVFI